MDDSGVEALEDDEINDIPKVRVSWEQVKNALQCSVCLDFFKVDEEAKALPCKHHFHECCIVPWLETRGTCPDCRLILVPEAEGRKLDDDNDYTHVIPSYVSLVSHYAFPERESSEENLRIPESVNGNVYYEEIDDEDESFRNLNDFYSHDDPEVSISIGVTINSSTSVTSPRSPVTSPISASDDEASESRQDRSWWSGSPNTNNDETMIEDDTTATPASSPSIITISDETVSSCHGYYLPFETHSFSDISSAPERMSIESISSTSDISIADDD